MGEIIPGILEKEWGEIEKKIEAVLPFARTIHIDLLDGKFANNTTFSDPTPFKKYADHVTLELHMMVEEPVQYLKPWAAAGFKRFLGHVEKMSDQVEFVAQGELVGEVGLVLDGDSPLDAITVPFSDLDTVLIMMIQAGFSGQQYREKNEEKIKQLMQKGTFPIAVDGGITDQTIAKLASAGATRFIANSFLFREDPLEQDKKLRTMLATVPTAKNPRQE